MSEAVELVIAQFGLALVRELGFRHVPRTDSYVYEGPRERTRTEIISALHRAH